MTGLGSFYTAAVVEYFAAAPNPSDIAKIVSKYNRLRMPILRPELLSSTPPGSIIAKMIDNEEQNDIMIFYPMFSHLNMPVKSGEQVIVIYGSAQRGDRIGYWISRKPSDLIAEDVNYTHNDRSNFGSSRITTDIAKQFPDYGLAGISYASAFQNSDSILNDFQGEAVPRFHVKAADTALQGSNNTLIVLGSNTTLDKEKSLESGLIDIVAGRGKSQDTAPLSTFSNTRGYAEVDKTGARNPNEGDLDFLNDLSRINISTGLNVDSDFSVGTGDNSGAAPAIVLKTDQIRLLARQDLKIVVGSGDNQSSILIKHDGNIVITPGSQIKLAGEADDQAYLRYDDFKSIIENIEDILGSLQTGVDLLNSAADTLAGVPPPSTGPLGAGFATVKETTISPALATIQSALMTIKSKKILGS